MNIITKHRTKIDTFETTWKSSEKFILRYITTENISEKWLSYYVLVILIFLVMKSLFLLSAVRHWWRSTKRINTIA